MASVSGTSGLGNTALRGFGGMASGIDRDAMIEQLTQGTNNKITKQKQAMTSLEWKQEAYRGISDKIIDMYDKYFSYVGTSSLTSGALFARSQVTSQGKEEYANLVSASGVSELTGQLSILGVSQLASSAVNRSGKYTGGSLETGITEDALNGNFKYSNLKGTQLRFGVWNNTEKGFDSSMTFNLPTTYRDAADGNKVKDIDFSAAPDVLLGQLNTAISQSDIKLGDKKLSEAVQFTYDNVDDKIVLTGSLDTTGYCIQGNSSALSALGYTRNDDANDGITMQEFNDSSSGFSDAYMDDDTSAVDYMKDKVIRMTFNGITKDITLLTADEAAGLKASPDKLGDFARILQDKVDKAFGGVTGTNPDGTDQRNITVKQVGGKLTFETGKTSDTISISGDSDMMDNWKVKSGASSKINLGGTLRDNEGNISKTGGTFDSNDARYYVGGDVDGELALKINGVDIKGLTKDSTVSDILSKINSNKDAGVKATYLDSTGEFVLVASETGAGRKTDLGDAGSLASRLFGGGTSQDGTNAIIGVSYGNGMNVTLERASNTFNLEGLSVTVSGVFNGDSYKNGTWSGDNVSASVTFSAKADVDGATEKVKKFFEDYNAIVTEVNTQVTTRNNGKYPPLTDAQKDEMSEESIKNWEKEGKKGLLYGDTTVQDLRSDLESVILKLMNGGADYEKLKEMGITYSDDERDGGTIQFDESKFKAYMEKDPEEVGRVFAGGGEVSKGLASIVENTFTPYATKYSSKNGNSYGRLIEEAGSEKIPLSMMDNLIYKQLEDMQDTLDQLNERLTTEQDRYISKFSAMETMISQMNSQSGWLSQLNE